MPWFVLVVVFACGRWVHAISSGWHHCARPSGQGRWITLGDTICVRDYNRCLEGENRRVLDVCKFPKQLFVEGWLDKGDACSPGSSRIL